MSKFRCRKKTRTPGINEKKTSYQKKETSYTSSDLTHSDKSRLGQIQSKEKKAS